MSRRSLLIVVTGPPASGKTTIARAVADEFAVPVFHKDEIKERLADEIAGTDLEWSRTLGSAAYTQLYSIAGQIVARGGDCIIEANFHPAQSIAASRRISAGARVVQILCGGDPSVLERRYRQRFEDGQRHVVHFDLDPERIDGFPTLFNVRLLPIGHCRPDYRDRYDWQHGRD